MQYLGAVKWHWGQVYNYPIPDTIIFTLGGIFNEE